MTTPLLTYRGTGGVGVNLDRFVASRSLIQANSGGGKSRALRYLLEQTNGRVQHLIIDPEGEFPTLRERFDYLLAAKSGGDVEASPKTAKILCRRLVEIGASAVLDLYELPLPDRREFVKLFITELMNLPRSLWRPILIVIDEAHMFCPERGSGESQSTEAVIQLCTQGRKRGFCAVLATQRISKLHKDAAAELLNKMIGRTGLDVDVKRAGEELGFDKEQRQALKTLKPGEFYVYGPAISDTVAIARTGDVVTTHPEPGSLATAAPATPAKVKAMLSQMADLPKEAEAEARSIAELQKQVKQLKGDLSRAQRSTGQTNPADVDRAVAGQVGKILREANGIIDQARTKINRFATKIEKDASEIEALGRYFTEMSAELRTVVPMPVSANGASAAASKVPPVISPPRQKLRIGDDYQVLDDSLSTPQQRMLDALASFEAIGVDMLAKSHVAVFSDQSSRSSGFRNNLSVLSAKGLIERVNSESVKLTDAGRTAASKAAAPATLEQLHEAWLEKLTGPQRLMLQLLLDEREGVARDDLARNSGQSPLSSGFRNNLSVLSALGLTGKNNGVVFASSLLYPDGL